LSVIVATAVLCAPRTALAEGLLRVRLKVWLPSKMRSSLIATLNVVVAAPAAKLAWPEAAA
jgi:hypothetical protein